jgi:phenylalanyl-tRNA synthetase beta chain
VLFELDLSAVLNAFVPQYREISRQPSVTRDLAIMVSQELELQTLVSGLTSNKPAIVREISLFDVYAGRGVEAGKKSLAFRIVMQDTQKTLLEADVNSAMQTLVTYLQETFAAQLRV